MYKFEPTSRKDLPHIAAWIKADPWHKGEARNDPEFLLTGKGLLVFCLHDDKGPVCYVRLDQEGELARVATQFGPEVEVSKRRVAVGLASAMLPAIKEFARTLGLKGLIYESDSPLLIMFCEKQGFHAVGNNDYLWATEENEHVPNVWRT
jgi:hypothetical protein